MKRAKKKLIPIHKQQTSSTRRADRAMTKAIAAVDSDVIAAVNQMRQLMNGASPIKGVDIKALIGEGRS